MKRWLALLIGFLLLSACSHEQRTPAQQEAYSWQKIVFLPSGLTIIAAKADSEEKRQKGLMGKEHLGDNHGMIFYFDETAFHAFWMFNTAIPLTVIFVDRDLVIVDVQHMEPCLSRRPQDCPVYKARRPSRFAIEIGQDVSRKYQIVVGDRIRFEAG